ARIVRPSRVERTDARGDDSLGRVEVGLPHPEADHVVHRREDVEEAPDPRRGNLPDAFGEGTLGEGRPGLRHRIASAVARSAGVGCEESVVSPSWVGSRSRHGAAAVSPSYARASWKSLSSDHAGAMRRRPTGIPPDRPHGIEIPGRPAMLTGSVQASDRYIATGSAIFAPNRKATDGDV